MDPLRYIIDRCANAFLPHTKITVVRGGDGLYRLGETELTADTWEAARVAAERHVLDTQHGVRVTQWTPGAGDDTSALFVTGVDILRPANS